ncbi:MAG TPA: PhoU domain-containing protein [Psychromonas sp.]
MGDQVIANLRQAMQAYAELDVQTALQVIQQDEQTNTEFDNISRLLITKMMEDPREIKNALHITWCARSLERIGDHGKNICEYVVYLVKGKDVRHTSVEQMKQVLEEF